MRVASGMELTPRDGQTFRFDAGTLCLEFLLSGALAEWEQLHTPQDLAAWIPRTRLEVRGEVRVEPADLERARRLRAAIQAMAERAASATAPVVQAAEAKTLTEFAAAPPPVPVLGPAADRGWAYPMTAAQYLSAVARDAMEVFTGPLVERVRMCGGERCLLLFLDTSRPGSRRWCSMDRCGNRQKLRTRRDRNPA
ncbi:CGNR zinc finger domain-containing protein [Nonomuraea sp. NPDC059194]|uniref:CGNR zinc finger domain-containing protein n=1 Tax=Nonomuraea sp. NPDC059194 TaxID=3346764 RepID=UPI003687DDEC